MNVVDRLAGQSLPLVDLYATACDWWPNRSSAHLSLVWFLLASYFNGVVNQINYLTRHIRQLGHDCHLISTDDFVSIPILPKELRLAISITHECDLRAIR